ncbi:MAG: hypothetical protein NVS3B21_23370 [Acidimicrobiales bacterium]
MVAGGAAIVVLADVAAGYRLLTAVHPVSVATAVERFRKAEVASAPPTASADVRGSSPAIAGNAPAPAGPAGPAAPTRVLASAAVVGAAPTVAQGGLRPAAVAATPSSPSVATALPAPAAGVYNYSTTGGEHADALGGIDHPYPSTTPVTITPHECGYKLRWDPLDARYDEYTLCDPGHRIDIADFVSFHNFASQPDRKAFTCDVGTSLRPQSEARETKFSGRCHSPNAVAAISGQVVGVENQIVAGTSIATLHVRIDETLTGSVAGKRSSDTWYSLANNLIVKRTGMTDAQADTSVGPTHYTENFTMVLRSTTPTR